MCLRMHASVIEMRYLMEAGYGFLYDFFSH